MSRSADLADRRLECPVPFVKMAAQSIRLTGTLPSWQEYTNFTEERSLHSSNILCDLLAGNVSTTGPTPKKLWILFAPSRQ